MDPIIPKPVSLVCSEGIFTIRADTRIKIEPDSQALRSVGLYLIEKLKPAAGFALKMEPADTSVSTPHTILLTIKFAGSNTDADASLGKEGYVLTVTTECVVLSANTAAGLFFGVQTLFQMLPAEVFDTAVKPGPWELAACVIRDVPRFPWRGVMLDVARSFFTVDNVKQFIDLMALYKLNRLHIHLTDDQGWRIEIKSWPRLAQQGGNCSVDGGNTGYYTQEQYADIVAYAQSRFISVVPEIDMPGHVNAALSCYAGLNPGNVVKASYSGRDVGFSSLAIDREITWKFIEDVIKELAAMTPGTYLHIGGDETPKIPEADYIRFVERVRGIVESLGKRMIGWGEIAKINKLSGVVVQHWAAGGDNGGLAKMAVDKGAKVIMSPADKAYLDMKYATSTALGLDWAGTVDVKDAYGWDPADFVKGVDESAILGVEAPLWSETIRSMADVEYMSFPRLAGLAEIGWSAREGRSWDEYRMRLAFHGARWTAMGVNFYRSAQVPWQQY
jgi:hexosaminidase